MAQKNSHISLCTSYIWYLGSENEAGLQVIHQFSALHGDCCSSDGRLLGVYIVQCIWFVLTFRTSPEDGGIMSRRYIERKPNTPHCVTPPKMAIMSYVKQILVLKTLKLPIP